MKSINLKAPVTCAKHISINAPKEKVWATLTNIDNWKLWQTDISDAWIKGPISAGTSFDWKTGGTKIRSVLHTVEPYQFGWTGKTLGLFAIHNWTLTGALQVTTVKVEESMEGLPAVIFKKMLQENLETGMQRWLEFLKRECER